MQSHLQVLQVRRWGVTHHRHYFTFKKQRKHIILPVLPMPAAAFPPPIEFLCFPTARCVVAPRQKSTRWAKDWKHSHREMGDLRIVYGVHTTTLRLLDVWSIENVCRFLFVIFLLVVVVAFLHHFNDYYVTLMINSRIGRHTHIHSHSQITVCYVLVCCGYCIAHGNRNRRWHHHGNTASKNQWAEKKADEDENKKTDNAEDIRWSHSWTHTHTLRRWDERKCVFYFNFQKRNAFCYLCASS